MQYFDSTQINTRIRALVWFGRHDLISTKDWELIAQCIIFFNDLSHDVDLKDSDGNLLLRWAGVVNDTICKKYALRAFYYLFKGDTASYLEQEGYILNSI